MSVSVIRSHTHKKRESSGCGILTVEARAPRFMGSLFTPSLSPSSFCSRSFFFGPLTFPCRDFVLLHGRFSSPPSPFFCFSAVYVRVHVHEHTMYLPRPLSHFVVLFIAGSFISLFHTAAPMPVLHSHSPFAAVCASLVLTTQEDSPFDLSTPFIIFLSPPSLLHTTVKSCALESEC